MSDPLPEFTIKDGLGWLVDGVKAQFELRGIDANVSIGWREPTKQINQGPGRANRIVFQPSDPSGKGGAINAVKLPGMRAVFDSENTKVAQIRGLRNWDRTIAIYVWGFDKDAPNDERKQYEETVRLFEWLMRAIQRVSPVSLKYGATDWLKPLQEHLFGRELQITATLTYPLLDIPEVIAYPENVAVTKELVELPPLLGDEDQT